MPHGPKGEWRPADPVARAVHIGRLATGQLEETTEAPRRETDHAAASRRASKAGKASADSRTPEQRRELAKSAAAARWRTDPAANQ